MNENPNLNLVNKTDSKTKIVFIVLAIFFFVLSAIFATCFILKNKEYISLQNDYKALTSTPKNETSNTTVLEKSKTDAEAALAKEKAREAKALQYNNIIGLLSDLIIQRGQLTKFTDADLAQTKTLAEKTGDTELISLMDTRWHDTNTDPAINVFTVIKYIQEKITSNIN